MSEMFRSYSFVWRDQMKRARDRWEQAERTRKAHFSFVPRSGVAAQMKYTAIVPQHLERRVRWLRDWLDYGQQLGERKFLRTD